MAGILPGNYGAARVVLPWTLVFKFGQETCSACSGSSCGLARRLAAPVVARIRADYTCLLEAGAPNMERARQRRAAPPARPLEVLPGIGVGFEWQ